LTALPAMSQTDLIAYQFSRMKVEQGDFTHFLSLYTPNNLPSGPALKAMLGRMLFCIEGYDADPREIYLIQEVRRFYAAFHQAWPYWLYFANLDTDGSNSMAICCLNSFTALKIDGQASCRVEYDPLELVHFIARDFPHMNSLCERAGMSEGDIFRRTRELFLYFKLPFDAVSD
jgi:hypothetical protein